MSPASRLNSSELPIAGVTGDKAGAVRIVQRSAYNHVDTNRGTAGRRTGDGGTRIAILAVAREQFAVGRPARASYS